MSLGCTPQLGHSRSLRTAFRLSRRGWELNLERLGSISAQPVVGLLRPIGGNHNHSHTVAGFLAGSRTPGSRSFRNNFRTCFSFWCTDTFARVVSTACCTHSTRRARTASFSCCSMLREGNVRSAGQFRNSVP